MKVIFLDTFPRALDALQSEPLGGSQSALQVAAFELARDGAEVVVAGRWDAEGEHHGVRHVDVSHVRSGSFADYDAVVTLNQLLSPEDFARSFRRRPRLIHWHQNDALSPYGKNFAKPEFHDHLHRFVFVSHAQASSFLSRYGLPASRVSVIPNPISYPFADLCAGGQPILPAKDPNLLVYLSAPNRGLEGLLTIIFPALREVLPAVRLEVYSGFYLDQGMEYQAKEGTDRTPHYEKLLREHHSPPAVSIQRGVSKPELAARLRRAAMLCYPCNYAETSCTAALEAMAAGCQVCTSTVGALRETTAGFAWLTPSGPDGSFDAGDFIKTALSALAERKKRPEALEARLQDQVRHVNHNHAPPTFGQMWRCLLECEIARRDGPAVSGP